MSKSLKIFFIMVIILMVILPNFIQATSIDMNLTNDLNNSITNNTNSSTITNSSNNNELNQNLINSSIQNTINPDSQTYYQSSTTGTLSNLPEANLGLSNILCIILIVIGVLLILLAIAILIRLKH